MSEISMELWSIDRLLREANDGNTRAFQMFCCRSLPGLRRYAAARCRELNVAPDLADDFVHDTFIKALRRLRRCGLDRNGNRPEVSAAWLRTIIYNSILDWCKKHYRVRQVDDDQFFNELSFTDERGRHTERHEELLEFFEWLTPRQRDVLELVYVNGATFQLAAEHLGISLDAAYKAHERGLQRLRDCVEQHGKAPVSVRP